MRAVRVVLVIAGVAFGLRGAWLVKDFTGEQLWSAATWVVGGVVLHDALLAPATVVLGLLAARVLPARLRTPASVAFVLWATVTVASIPVLSGQGGKPDNDTILHRPYLMSWLVLTTVLALGALVASRFQAVSEPDEASGRDQ